MAGLGNGNNGHNYMVGAQAEVVVNELEDTEVYLGKDIAPGSFGWLVPLPESRALIGIVSRQKLNGHMGRFLSRLQTNGKIGAVIKSPRRWGIPLKPLAKTYRDRVIAVGDAAGLAKPTTGGGIYYALISGEMASETANGAFVAGDWSARRLSGYEKAWRSVFGRELRIGYYARMLYEALGDRQIESVLRETLCNEAQEYLIRSREFSFDWHSAVILKTIGRRGFGHLIRSFGPTVAPFLSRLVGARRSSN
jgi:flavin-dependent dehydrogenase